MSAHDLTRIAERAVNGAARAPLVTAVEVAADLRVNKLTVYSMHARGLIPGYRIGRALRFDLDKVRAALAEAEGE